MTCGTFMVIRLNSCCPLVVLVATHADERSLSKVLISKCGFYFCVFFKLLLKNAKQISLTLQNEAVQRHQDYITLHLIWIDKP